MKGFENLFLKFTDKQGLKYYAFDPGGVPFVRFQQQREFVKWLMIGQSEQEYMDLIDHGSKALAKGVKGMTAVAAVLQEQEFRVNIIKPQLVYQLMAASIVREDEDPLSWHKEIQEEKALMIEEDMTEQMQFFFALQPWMTLLIKPPHIRDRWRTILKGWEQEEHRRVCMNQALTRSERAA